MGNKKFKFYDLSDDNSFVQNKEDNTKNIIYSKPSQVEPFQEQLEKPFLDKKENNISFEDKLEKISEQVSDFEKTTALHEKNYFNNINGTTINDKKNLSNFDDNKIESFFSYKQKLDVKTNIYLKHDLVSKIQDLSKKTGDSRSLVINKLIEIALKELEIK